MASRFHKFRTRLAEREPLTAHGRINLVPLVDILTAIVFFSLLTYTGAVMTNLTAFDLALPPVVVTGEQAKANAAQPDTVSLILAVGIKNDMLRVEHSGGGSQPFAQNIAGTDKKSLDELQAVLTDIKTQYPDNADIMVVPDDDVSYDNIVHVLERVKFAKYKNIALTSTARSMQVAAEYRARGGR